MQMNLPQERPFEKSTEFNQVLSNLSKKVEFKKRPKGYFLIGPNQDKEPVEFEEVENMVMDELLKTNLHFDVIGDDEFQKLLNIGMKSIEDGRVTPAPKKVKDSIEDELDEDELEDEMEDEEEDESEETPDTILFSVVEDICQEFKANEDIDEEYLSQRLSNALVTKGLYVDYLEE